MKQKKKVIIITEIPFWRHFAGHTARLSSLIEYLKDRIDLTVLLAGLIYKPELKLFRKDYKGVRLIHFDIQRLGPANFADFVMRFMNIRHFDTCIVEYIELSYILDSIPDKTRIFLDTHDLKSKRENEFAKIGLKHEKFTWKEEIEIFKQYDKVLLIQKPDFLKVSRILRKKRALYIPHAVKLPKQKIRRKARNIGFIASSYPMNIEGLNWFLNKVWDFMDVDNCQLNIYGSISSCNYYFKSYPNVYFLGPYNKPEDVYSKVDILINPVRFGSGLKIKNIEALGSGIPLITFKHGAIGLEDISDIGFLVAHDNDEFRDKLSMLISDYKLRKDLSDRAYSYTSEFFSPEVCYSPLEKSINES